MNALHALWTDTVAGFAAIAAPVLDPHTVGAGAVLALALTLTVAFVASLANDTATLEPAWDAATLDRMECEEYGRRLAGGKVRGGAR